MKTYRVLFVTSKSLGGSGKYISVLAEALKSRGVICDLIYFPLGVQQDAEIESSFVRTYHFATPPGLSPLVCWRNALQVRRLLKTVKYDIVHTHTSLGGTMGRLGALMARQHGLFVGHTIHAYGADEFTPIPQKWFYWVIERAFDNLTDGYVSPSNYMVQYGGRTHLITTKKATVIYNSLPLKSPADDRSDQRARIRGRLGIKDNVSLMLFCGRLERQKGVDVILEAMGRLKLADRIYLVVCGVGDDEPKLKEMALQLGIHASISWEGWQSDVSAYYAAADMYVMPSRWESFGLVFLEAMNYSLPVLSTNVQAIPEVVVHQETGLLCDSDDASALAENINKMVDDQMFRQRLGRAGKLRQTNYFKFNNFVDQHVEWYEQAISMNAGR